MIFNENFVRNSHCFMTFRGHLYEAKLDAPFYNNLYTYPTMSANIDDESWWLTIQEL